MIAHMPSLNAVLCTYEHFELIILESFAVFNICDWQPLSYTFVWTNEYLVFLLLFVAHASIKFILNIS